MSGVLTVKLSKKMLDVIHLFSLDVICLQETKLERVDNALMRNVLGPAFDSNFSCLPAQGSVGDYHCC
jgi:exonuclease III